MGRLASSQSKPATSIPISRNSAISIKLKYVSRVYSSPRSAVWTLRTGITAYLQNGGTLEHAQQIAAHQSPRTTKLYDRTKDEISLEEVERIKF